MKYYLFQILVTVACAACLIWRPFPGWGAISAASAVIIASCVLTAKGVKDAVDDMWWRMAISCIAFLIIGIAGA